VVGEAVVATGSVAGGSLAAVAGSVGAAVTAAVGGSGVTVAGMGAACGLQAARNITMTRLKNAAAFFISSPSVP
jgi:hypothetical protein